MAATEGTDVYRLVAERDATAATQDGLDLWERLDKLSDPSAFRPELAPDIELKDFHTRWGNDYVMIGNTRRFLYYQLEPEEGELVRMMDGTRTVKELVVERFQQSGDLELANVAGLVRQLEEGDFFTRRFVDVDAIVDRALHPAPTAKRKARQFVRTLSVDWTGAERWIRWMYDHGLKWFFRRGAVAFTSILSLLGIVAFVAVVRRGGFSLTGGSLATGFVGLLLLEYLMVFVHELGHALVLVRFDRRIKSVGFLIYFGSPSFFVESSDGLMLDRHQSIMQSLAGPYAQLIVGAVASFVALAFPDWFLSETLYRFATLNYFVLLMNLIPLLELDGYYVLSDVLQVPDLRERSLRFMRYDLWHKLWHREHFTASQLGLGAYSILGFAFTVFSFYTAYFYWTAVFGGFVSRLWNGGAETRILLLVLALFLLGPIIRGLVKALRSVGRQVRALWQRLRFRVETRWRVEAAKLIDTLPMFDDVPEDVLSDLAGRVGLRSLTAGQPVFRQGDRPDAFYVIRRGALHVVEEDPDTGGSRVLRVLGPGGSFGELGLVNGAPRAATVRAITDAQVFAIDKGTFDRLLIDMLHVPEFGPTLQAAVELRELRCFAHLSGSELAELVERGEWVAAASGDTIIRQGEIGDSFYALVSGQVDVVRDGLFEKRLGPGAYFGEIALLLDVPRTASIVARTPVRMFRIDRAGFDRLVAGAFSRGTLDPSISITETLTH
jgi:putative peptide zinc metalloprotease protein